MKKEIIYLKPFKNWVTILLLFSLLIIILIFLIFYSIILFLDNVYILIVPILIIIILVYLIVKNITWLIFGIIEIHFLKNEIVMVSKSILINKKRYFQIEEIKKLHLESIFLLKKIKKIPIIGDIYFNLLSSTKRDNKSLIINYKGVEITFLNNLTLDKATYIIQKILENYPNRSDIFKES